MSKMSSRKKAAMMLVPAATAGGFIGLTAQAAHAQSGGQPVTYTDLNGNTVHCDIQYDLNYGSNGPNTLEADTAVTGGGECTDSTVEVDGTYKANSDGVQVTNISEGFFDVVGVWANVMNAKVSTVHTVNLNNCDSNQSVCTYTFNLSHGK